MIKRLLFVSGEPGVGKTTLLLSAVEALKTSGWNVGGMISHEVRSRGGRIGFEIVDLKTGSRGWLAHIDYKEEPRIGRYGVNLIDLERLGSRALVEAAESADVIAIDEIGPMELLSDAFRKAVRTAINSGKLVIGVVHARCKDELVEEMKIREDAEVLMVTSGNRDTLGRTLVQMALVFLEKKRESRACP